MRTEKTEDFPLYFIVGLFVLDNVVNYFAAIPIYVASIPLSVLILFCHTHSRRDRILFIVCMACVLASVAVNFIRFDYSMQDISDILFVIQFFAAFFYARHARVSARAISVATVAFALLFLPTFLGVNAMDYSEDVFISGSRDVEFLRLYNQGLYRLPHVAAYMLAFSGLWWLWVASRTRNRWHYALALMFIVFTLYTGSRTPFFVFVAAYFASSIRFRAGHVMASIGALLVVAFFVLFFSQVLDFLYGTFLYQYFSLFETLSENYDRLSRVIIWSSWLSAISQFNGIDFLFGRDFSSSFDFNLKEIGLSIWFHNDFMSIFYSYGIVVLGAYLVPYFVVLKEAIRKSESKLIEVCGIFIPASAFINGFYKYLPIVFFLFLMSKSFAANRGVIARSARMGGAWRRGRFAAIGRR